MAKKCTNEGRALMQIDFQQFLIKVNKMTTVRPIPEKEMVEEYIKADHLSEPALEQWIKNREEYTMKQLTSLITCIVTDKKSRLRMIDVIETKFGSLKTASRRHSSCHRLNKERDDVKRTVLLTLTANFSRSSREMKAHKQK